MGNKNNSFEQEGSSKEWFDQPDPTGLTDSGEIGLRFTCTQCGNCCTGPTGFVLFTDDEAGAMAEDLGITKEKFFKQYTRDTIVGRSLNENEVDGFGYDCVFLTREEKTGKTGCSIYKSRPEQCRTWPFWKSNLTGKRAWKGASSGCPGMDTGSLHKPGYIRVTRDRVDI
jgi:uncharacterized protein